MHAQVRHAARAVGSNVIATPFMQYLQTKQHKT